MSERFNKDLFNLTKLSDQEINKFMDSYIPMYSVIQYRSMKKPLYDPSDTEWHYAVRVNGYYFQEENFQFFLQQEDGYVDVFTLLCCDVNSIYEASCIPLFSDLDENVKVIKEFDNFADAFNYLRNLAEGVGSITLKEV